MAFTAGQVLTLAGRVLQDEAATRWTFAELLDWLNEGVSAIVLVRPSASSTTVTMGLQAGTLQALPSGYISLLKITRNVTAAGPPIVGGRAIRITSRDALDAIEPDWHNPKRVKYKSEVKQYTYDEEEPLSFYVYPGNDGTGVVEAIVCELPAPLAATGDPTLIASYAVDVALKDIYLPPLLDWVIYRAFSKDDTAGSPAISQQHFQAFATALGVTTQVASATSPNASPQPGSAS